MCQTNKWLSTALPEFLLGLYNFHHIMVGKSNKTDIANLHLPHILCLHGGGTNARIFRVQCRVLEAQLKNKFRLCYAEAPFASNAGPDVLSAYKNGGLSKDGCAGYQNSQRSMSRQQSKKSRNRCTLLWTRMILGGQPGSGLVFWGSVKERRCAPVCYTDSG